ncbi:hypothetical protein [Stakelama tenebrarum]|uniref:Uncharacterized protein n=1 Tax=Stakelama tenebrarum TaxID=2711215 RepID=A0A6G6Y311_9SPHN|nr:hypothetical protein [Sphingosinithalassobacter tenebrarum]QIG78993.1 hypothetical protein G5C33_03805 [Sphingosinithalassobacter tenebrarum]
MSALGLTGCVLALRLAWAQPQRRALWLCAAAIALFATVFFALQATSAELAVATLSVAVSVPALGFVVANATRRPRVSPKARVAAVDDPMASTRLALRWASAGLCAPITAAAAAAAAAIWLPGGPDLRMISAILLFPLLWAALGGWALGSAKPAHLSAAMALVAGIVALAIIARNIQ